MSETATAAVRAAMPAAAPALDHISWSGVTTYCACPRKFYYRYIERAPEEFVPAALAFGGAFHRAVELIHEARLQCAPIPDSDALLAGYDHSWSEATADAPEVMHAKDEDAVSLRETAQRMLTVYREHVVAAHQQSMPHKLTLEKRSQRQLNPAILYRQLSRLVQRALAGSRKRQRWMLRGNLRTPSPVREGDGWLYRTSLRFERRGRRVAADIETRQFEYITRIVEVAGSGRGWTISGRPGVQTTPAEPTPAGPIHLPESTGEFFAHIYDREEQIGIVTQAIKAAIRSGFQNRNHCVLFGPPACGKSEILLAFKRMLGADAVMQFDATSTTEAGARRELRQLATIPPILVVEEIEKTDERSLRWL